MKFLRYFALCAAVLVLGTWTARAAENGVDALAGYCQEQNFYAFVSMDDWPDAVTAKAQFDGKTQPFTLEQTPSPLEKTETPVSYLLLIDRSGSMYGEKNERDPQSLIRGFADALYDAAGGGAKFSVATFDEHFNNDATGYTDNKRTFLKDVNAIRYTAKTTDLTRSILEAVEYLDGCQRVRGELVNLVLVTDGIPDGAENRLTLAAAAGEIAVSPSILLHTFGIGTSDPRSAASLDSLAQLGRGAHTATSNNRKQDAEGAAREVATLVNGLYPLQFTLDKAQSKAADAIIFFQDRAVEDGASTFAKLADVPVLNSTGEVVSKAESKAPEPVEIPDGEASETNPVDGNESEAQGEPKLDDDAEKAEKSGEDTSSGTAESSSGGGAGQDAPKDEKPLPVIAAVGAAAAVLAVLAGVYFVIRRRRPDGGTGEEIYMRLEVISGQVAAKEQEFYLTDELIIGKARDCDLILKEPNLAKHCARVYLSDHIIWIEDIGAPDGVYLGDMRIYNANRLRSGDEISIGNARFLFKF